MLIRLNDHWYVDAPLVSAVTYCPEKCEVGVFFHGSLVYDAFQAPESEVVRIVNDVNEAKRGKE